jgi:outer membrane receptor for ferrienterochelin and colicin
MWSAGWRCSHGYPQRRQNISVEARNKATIRFGCAFAPFGRELGWRSRPRVMLNVLTAWRLAAIALVQIVCVAWSAGARADDLVSLIDVLATLRAQGYQIIYSNDLVTTSQRIDVGVIDLEAVQAAVARIGLRLSRSGDLWLVVRDQEVQPSLTLRVVSASGAAIEAAEFQFGRQGERTLVSGADGRFRVQWPAYSVDAVTIRVRDHYPRTLPLSEIGGLIVLQPIDRVETVIVTGSRHVVPSRIASESATSITRDEMNSTPSLAGDSMRVTNRLPGMSSVGVSAKPLVRGGVQDETLTLIDGLELLDPFHLADFQNMFSSVDSRIVSEINVYTGGFPARYGNRMSGVVDIAALAPDVKPRTEVGISMLSAFANTRGSSEDQQTDWLASARHGNLEYLANWIDPNWGKPTFDDAYVRVGRQLGDNVKAYAGVLYSRDDTSITDNDRAARSDIETSYWWTRLDVTHSESLRSSTMVSYVDSDRNKMQRSTEPGVSVGSLDYDQQMRKGALRSDFSFEQGVLLMEFGWDIEYAQANYDSVASVDRGSIGALLGNPADAFDIHTEPSGWSGGTYWSTEVWLTNRIALQPGIRWDFQDYYTDGLESQISPRFGIRWDATDTATLRLSAGRYCQPEGIQEMKATDGVDHFLTPQKSNHVVGSLEWAPRRGLRLLVESYYKDYQEARPRFDNLFNQFVVTPELEPDRAAIPVGHAMVKGIDAQARFEIASNWVASLRYGYMDADDRIEGVWKPRAWSQRHTVQNMLTWQSEAMSAGLALTWHSGWRTTRLPASVPINSQIPLVAIYNNGILNDYISLDLSASRTWHIGHASITAQSDITNALNHSNRGGVDYNSVETATDLLLTPNNKSLFPWIPTVGVSVAF